MEEDRMVPSFPGIIPSESPRLSCPEFEERSLASRAIRVWHAGQDPRIAGCLQAIMAWRYCPFADRNPRRSEEHTSELQSQSNLVCRLLLEKKKHSLCG